MLDARPYGRNVRALRILLWRVSAWVLWRSKENLTIVDWAAFTLPIPYTERQPLPNEFQKRIETVMKNMGELMPLITAHCADYLTLVTPQRPYRRAYCCPNVGFRINADHKRKEVLIVFNGQACEMVRGIGRAAIIELLVRVEATGSRLDFATDISTLVSPADVQERGWSKRILSKSYIESAQGKTLYIGSRKSDAFCRVYKYNSPHPRSDKLRIEFELKKLRARAVAGIAIVDGVETAARSVAARYEFGHATVQDAFRGHIRQIKTEAHMRSMASTEMWLLTQAAPAFLRLVREGVISNPRAWVERYFLGNTDKLDDEKNLTKQ